MSPTGARRASPAGAAGTAGRAPLRGAPLREALGAEARRLGFCSVGVASTRPFRLARRRGLEAIAGGRMEGMPWFTPQRVEAAADLGRRHPWARSILSLAFPYRPARLGGASPPAAEEGRPRGRFSAYVCLDGGDGAVDYHALLARRCDALAAWLQDRVPDLRAKCLVDHGWTFDRAIAERAGVGFIGRSSALITREAGSYVLLAELLLSVPLPPTARSRRSCGGCRACLAACPTGALVGPGAVDARRCISYLTIEHRGQLDTGLRPLIGTWAFGCDVCQEACPINARLAPPALEEERAATDHGPVPFPDLVECLGLDDAEFSRRFRSTAVRRAGRARLARNCAVALGNAGDPAALPALRRAAATDPDATVRDAARWATEHLTNAAGRFPLL